MDFTGERFVPELGYEGEIGIEHFQRYLSINGLIDGKIVLDIACGEGYGSNIISTYASRVYGMDISKEAIENAKRKYNKENLEFCQSSVERIELDDNSVDVVVSFETIEHVNEELQKKFMSEVNRILKKEGILVISSPNKEVYSDVFKYNNEFHIKEFYEQEFIDFLSDYFKNIKKYKQSFEISSLLIEDNPSTLKVINTESINKKKTKYSIAICSNTELPEQLYLNSVILDTPYSYLDQILRIIELQEKTNELSKWGKSLDENIKVYLKDREILSADNNKLNKEIIELDKNIKDYMKYNSDLNKENDKLNTYNLILTNKVKDLDDNIINLTESNEFLSNEKIILTNKVKELDDNIINLTESNEFLSNEKIRLSNELNSIYNSNFWKLALKYYWIVDNVWPFKQLYKYVRKAKAIKKLNNITDNETDNHDSNDLNNKIEVIDLNLKLESYEYKKQDIIFLSVISWDFRYQRPQHLALNLAKLGHRVFYFNVDFKKKLEINKRENDLYIVDLDNHYGNRIYDVDYSKDDYINKQLTTILNDYNIRDCSVIVEYPSWYPVCEFIKDKYNFNIIFDYIDDYEGFEDTTHSGLIKLTDKLFELNDLTIATSSFLYEKTKRLSENVKIVRNGTEFDFFNKALTKDSNKKAKKVGYYGAIAEWFDIEKVDYIAKNLPDVEIELIGNVSYDKCYDLSKYKNVKFLGEKNYNDLPAYLSEYDVCLIPFKSDIDLIKATNPVKFYEYLSAGKRIVATEIPELIPYKDKYVYLSNCNDEFINYVRLCLNNEDTLANTEEKVKFAKTNDWAKRCQDIEKYIYETHKLVSIIVVTYNNLDYTKKCIDSIIEKSAYPNYEIIIVDNASSDDTPSYLLDLQKKYNNITVKLNKENKGFAGGNNDGLRIAKGEYLILLNNDTLVTRGWINGLIKHIGINNIGMVCPVTNSIGNEAQIMVEYKEISDMDKFAIEYTTKNYNKIYEDINVLAMFCVAFSREVFKKAGFLDENYKVGMFEDDDYSAAVKQAGYKIACIEDVFIHHFGSVSFKKLEDKTYRKIFETNKAYYEKKWNTIWTPHKYRDGVNM